MSIFSRIIKPKTASKKPNKKIKERKQPSEKKQILQDYGLMFGLKQKPDVIFIVILAAFIIFGLIMVYDSSAVVASKAPFYDQFAILKNQLVNVAIGLVGLLFFYFLDYRRLGKWSLFILIGSIVLLVAVLFLGETVNGAKRWLTLGGVNVQVSEIAKFAFVIYLAFWLNRVKQKINKLNIAFLTYIKTDLLPFLLLLAIIGTLVLIQPDLGTAAIIAITAGLMFFISNDDLVHFVSSVLVFILLGVVLVAGVFLQSYRQKRLNVYTELLTTGRISQDKVLDSGYQQQQVLIAISSGGLGGVGFGESKQKYFYLVDQTAYTDTIFAVIAEELGLIGSVILVIAYLIFILRGLKIAQNAPDKIGALLVYGIIIWVGLQSFLNIAANVALIPFKGITLPFLSYGGSSIVVILSAMGIVLNVSKYKKVL
ncbi:MAG: putative peptidoglycan glycosyltransferase FtsW [bacterium]